MTFIGFGNPFQDPLSAEDVLALGETTVMAAGIGDPFSDPSLAGDGFDLNLFNSLLSALGAGTLSGQTDLSAMQNLLNPPTPASPSSNDAKPTTEGEGSKALEGSKELSDFDKKFAEEFSRLISEYVGHQVTVDLKGTEAAHQFAKLQDQHNQMGHNVGGKSDLGLAQSMGFNAKGACAAQNGHFSDPIAAARAFFEQWKASPGHDAIMKSAGSKIGIAMSQDGGSSYATLVVA